MDGWNTNSRFLLGRLGLFSGAKNLLVLGSLKKTWQTLGVSFLPTSFGVGLMS